MFHFTTFLLGAYLLEDLQETFSFCLLLSSLTVFPISLGYDARWELFVDSLKNSYIDCISSVQDAIKMTSVFAVLGAWLGAIPICLDWDRDWQTWPITCVMGAMCGHIMGSLAVILLYFLSRLASNKNKLI